ncbi:XAP5-domain-containing protein [Byssothecium circinans]|uniref:XAP5-domain-containing protein n=1 Tax=Byssothecium circinans TaxID=147558 RepID=A0A6A5TF08_9PLEO|nr:XAP5-domain-containing protein [Byssothecium circinans]
MDKFAPASNGGQGRTPTNSRFTAQSSSMEDDAEAQTVGLIHADGFQKRRAEAPDQKESGGSGASTPQDGACTPKPSLKKKRKVAGKGKLSFGLDDDQDGEPNDETTPHESTAADSSAVIPENDGAAFKKKKFGANSKIGMKPRVMTKSALQRDAQQAEQARQDFIVMREAVKKTEVVIPFVFYDGTNTPGGRCRIKKGDYIWLFLDKARKVGAELGVGGGDKSRREWARVSVDDLMFVRGGVILPHHYDLYYFLFNKVSGFNGLIFDYSAQPTKATPSATDEEEAADFNPLDRPDKGKEKTTGLPDEELEGFDDDPAVTKVVDRRWYEQNKHIFPASVWEEYSPEKNLAKAQRKDVNGNSFFFS